MNWALVTGSAGLVGSNTVGMLIKEGLQVIGIDNDMRGQMFGAEASVQDTAERLRCNYKDCYSHLFGDIRSEDVLAAANERIGEGELVLVVHCASQPSHDWAVQAPMVDFDINARATLQLMEWIKHYHRDAVVVYLSTNKVYGDWVNTLLYEEKDTRWEPIHSPGIREHGLGEWLTTDNTKRSLFGVSKLAGDLIVQEYGQYFDMSTYCLRCGCLTGIEHKAVSQHGFLAYLAKCVREEVPYTVIGYKGKQVRDNLDAADVAGAIREIGKTPSPGAHVYNLGGGRANSVSILEAMATLQELVGKKLTVGYHEPHRLGDHRWWITDTRKFRKDFPGWKVRHDLGDILSELARG